MSSDLPQITNEQILQRVVATDNTTISDLKSQVSHLGLIAEALRDERDALREEVSRLQEELARHTSDPVPDISSLGK